MKRRATATVWVLLANTGVAQADEPLPPPAVHRASSPNGKFEVVSDPSSGTKLIESGTGKRLCGLPGWFRSIYVATDGEHFATGYSGLNLVPLNAGDSLELIGFWRRCRKFESVPLRAVPERSILRRTVSHYAWGNITGVDASGRLVVTRIDGRTFRFNMASGKTE
jgi:hypothetical protein